MDSDDETSIFANRANRIFQTKSEAYEKYKNEKGVEESKKAEADEFEDLMGKIKSQLKRKPVTKTSKRGRKPKKAKPEPDSAPVSEDEASNLNISIEEAISPPKRTTKRTRQLDKAAKEMEKVETTLKLPAGAKRRLEELKLRTDREIARVEEEVMRTLSSCDKDCLEVSETTSLIELERTITLKIRYMSEISKISVLETEKFANIFNKVAELYKLKASEILLCVEDQNIQLDDTPLSLKLKFYDIIDCIPFKASEVVEKEDPNTLLVKFQSSDSRKKIEMQIHKLEKFRDFMEKYSKQRGIPIEDLTFEFDGETIEGSETPEELDMESGSCIDVKVAKTAQKEEKDISIVEDYIAPIPQSKMLDICVID